MMRSFVCQLFLKFSDAKLASKKFGSEKPTEDIPTFRPDTGVPLIVHRQPEQTWYDDVRHSGAERCYEHPRRDIESMVSNAIQAYHD
jgi:hypothetical protein